MKKFIAVALTALICFSLAACGSDVPDSLSAEKNTDITESVTSAEDTSSTEDVIVTESIDEKINHPSPKVQDIQKFLVLDTPYDIDIGTFGSMDFMYSLESGSEELMRQFMDILVENYSLSLVDIFTYDYESATFKDYQYMYSGEGEEKLQRENMDWDVSVGITVHKDKPEVTVGVFYVNGFQLVDDGYRADYSKVVTPVITPEPTPVPTQKPAAAPAQKPAQNTAPTVTAIDKNAAYIPDFSAFLNRSPSEDKDRYYGGTRKYYQKISLSTQQTVVSEILALLDNDRYQLELIEKVSADDRIEYNYRYTGNMGMDSIHSKNDDSRYYNLQFTVYNRNNDNGTYGIHFHYSPQFVEENVGYTVSANAGSTGGGGGGTIDFEDDDLPDHSKLQCLTCDGDGDCTKCGGSTYIGYGDARAKCDRCKGTGDCRTCGGSGTR
ncbi:MAG: hypothetical protein E7488_05040 [Ruminococcaceae bacterium]|nr:hypothetical protein [Oscillospiraceae bacterium]